MKILLLILIQAFITVNILATRARADLSPKRNPMSSYLVGPYQVAMGLAYLGLAIALALLPGYLAASWWRTAIFELSAAGLIGVVATAHWRARAQNPHWAQLAHKASAATAFLGTTAALMIYGWNRQVLMLLALVALTLLSLFLWIAPDETAIEERTYSGLLLVGLTLLVLSPDGAPA